jgi:hypothetical protein
MNDSGSRREIAAELLVMAGAAWVIPASSGRISPDRRISFVSLPGYLNTNDISWVVEYPASQPAEQTAPRSNTRTSLCGRMIRSAGLRRILFGAIVLGLLSFFVAVGRSEAQPIAMLTNLVGRAETINSAARVPLGIMADLPDGACNCTL